MREDDIRSLRAQLPDPPWGWFGFASQANAYLATQWGGRKILMSTISAERPGDADGPRGDRSTFHLQDLQGEQLRRGNHGCGFMRPIHHFAELNHNTEIVQVNHPVAKGIQQLPVIIDFLLGRIADLKEGLDAAAGILRDLGYPDTAAMLDDVAGGTLSTAGSDAGVEVKP